MFPAVPCDSSKPRRWNLWSHPGIFATMHGHVQRGGRKPRSSAVLAILALVAGGCATVPDADNDIAEATASASAAHMVLGPDGLLTVSQSNRLLSSIAV